MSQYTIIYFWPPYVQVEIRDVARGKTFVFSCSPVCVLDKNKEPIQYNHVNLSMSNSKRTTIWHY